MATKAKYKSVNGELVEFTQEEYAVDALDAELAVQASLDSARTGIEQQRDAVLAAGVDHNGLRWHADLTFLSELTTIILGYTIGVRSGLTAIRTKQNTIEHLDLPALIALAGAVGNHRAAAYALSWAAKDALNAS